MNRDELQRGAEELGVDFEVHLGIVIDALAGRGDQLMGAGAATG